jgi:pimeloyl-ACP methyl ester carboxylesterase
MSRWVSENIGPGIHVYSGGEGSTVVLVPGWPETAEAYSELFPLLAQNHSILCVDPPGLGDSAPSEIGYDTGTIGRTLEQGLCPRIKDSFHLVGHDVGAWIAYAWAAQFPNRVRSLTLIDAAIPGLAPPRAFPLPFEINKKLWQFSFNVLPELPELLTRGRERELFDWLFEHKAEHPERIPRANRDRYVECYAKPGRMSAGFAYYRSGTLSASQNIEFSQEKLPMPVLALGGSGGMGEHMRSLIEPLAERVDGGAIEDCGHYVMEEQPDVLARRLLGFLASAEGSAR